MAKRRVAYAKLHDTDAFIPGVGGLGNTLPPTSKNLNMTMWRENGGDLEFEILLGGRKIEGAIPAATVKVVTYVSEPTIVKTSEKNSSAA